MSERCAARESMACRPDAMRKPRKASPRTPGSGAIACACEVARPPNDFPPAISGSPDNTRGFLDCGPHRRMRATAGASGRLLPFLHTELVAQTREPALAQTGCNRLHEWMDIPAPAPWATQTGARVVRPPQQRGRRSAVFQAQFQLLASSDCLAREFRHLDAPFRRPEPEVAITDVPT